MKVIKTAAEHEAAVERLAALMTGSPAVGSPEMDELELLGVLIDDYERRLVPPAAPTPAEAIRFRLEQAGLRRRALAPYLGSESRVSEVLAGKRRLSLAMIRRLHEGLGIPLASLVGRQEEPCKARRAAGRRPAVGAKRPAAGSPAT